MLVAPAASCAVKKAHEFETTGSTGATRPSLRNGLRLMARSPRSTGLDSLRRLPLVIGRLDPSVGGSGPRTFAVRRRHHSSRRRGGVHHIPHSTFVTTRNAPLAE